MEPILFPRPDLHECLTFAAGNALRLPRLDLASLSRYLPRIGMPRPRPRTARCAAPGGRPR